MIKKNLPESLAVTFAKACFLLCNYSLLQRCSSGGHHTMVSVCLCQMQVTFCTSSLSSQVRLALGQV